MKFRLLAGVTALSVALTPGLMVVGRDRAWAAASTATDATPNFTESSGCGTYGLRGPLSLGSSIDARIYGPFADFYGRDRTQVSNSIRNWMEPSGRILKVHQRALPAFEQARANVFTSGAWYTVTDGSGWVWRNVSGARQMSQHATGSAVDLNPARNPYRSDGTLITNFPSSYLTAYRNAGLCWGGDWLTAKDAMHFSWRGPAASAGQTARLAPYPPLTASAGFTSPVVDLPVAIPQDGNSLTWALGDRRRDGADDLYALRTVGGKKQVQVAGAVTRFATVGIRRDSASSAGGIDLFADGDGDGRADLWRFDGGSGSVKASMYPDSNRFRSATRSITTTIAWSADAELALALYDYTDWIPDLFVIRRSTGQVEVYSGSSGFSTKLLQSNLPFAPGSDQIVIADRNVDGMPDIWAVGQGSGAGVRIAIYSPSTGYSSNLESLNTGMNVAPGAAALPGDWDGDGRTDLYVVSGGRVRIYLGGVPDRAVSALDDWFTPSDPVYFDAGPLCATTCDSVGFVETSGVWNLARKFEWGAESVDFFYGNPGDTPFMGDWDGDGVDTPGLFRRSDGFVYLRNSNTQGVADIRYFFGNPGDIPIVGDWDGDGRDTVSIYRPSEARFYIINRLGSAEAGLGPADFFFDFGDPGDTPVVGDFDGDSQDEVGLHRVTTGRVYYRLTLTTGRADADFIFGDPGDVVVAADWDGDGTDTVGLYRPSDGQWYIRLSNTQGVADHVIPFGVAAPFVVQPVVGRTKLSESGSFALAECAECSNTGS